MDCIGLQALSDSSESDIDESLTNPDRINEDVLIDNSIQSDADAHVPKEPTIEEKKEYLYSQYKDGLKILMKGSYDEAEAQFELILANSYLSMVKKRIHLFV